MSGLEELSATSQEPIDYRSFRKRGGGVGDVYIGPDVTSGLNPVETKEEEDARLLAEKEAAAAAKAKEDEKLTPPGEIDITTGNCHNVMTSPDGTPTYRQNGVFMKDGEDRLIKSQASFIKYVNSDEATRAIFEYLSGKITGSITDKQTLADAIKTIYTTNETSVVAIMNYLVKTDPSLSLKLLEKLGFQTQKPGSIKRVESVDSWFAKEVSASDSTIKLNNRTDPSVQALCNFLQLVVDYVNCNPGFLNPGLKGSTDENDFSSQMPQSAYSKNAGLKYHYTSCRRSCGNNDLLRLTQTMKSRQAPVSLVNGDMCSTFNLCGGYRIGNSIKVQSGGGAGSVSIQSGTSVMNNLFLDATSKLQQVGRTLKPESKTQVETLLKQMYALEKEVYSTVQDMQVLVEKRRLNRDGSSLIVDLAQIKDCAAKQAAVSNQFCNTQSMCLKVLTQLEKMADNTREPIGSPHSVC